MLSKPPSCWGFFLLLSTAYSFSLNTNNCDRRTALSNLVSAPAAAALVLSHPLIAVATPSTESYVCTLVIDSPEAARSVGIKLVDVNIDGKDVPSVDKVEPDSLAAKSGVKQGMVVLGKDSATKSSSKNLEFRLSNGPYPFIVQFATPAMLTSNNTLQQTQEKALDPYDRIAVKSMQKPDNCSGSAKRGDTVTIAYEARISSSSGPMYDSTAWRQGEPSTFELGKGFALPGVEIGLNGMCVGEIREIDVPTTLGYGKFGSQVFDVPGDMRLWWRVELLDLTKGQRKLRII